MKKKKRYIKILSIFLTILILFLIILIIVNSELLKKKEIKKIKIRDECSFMVGSIIHQIKNENDCKNICMAECSFRKMKFFESEFTEIEGSCNECICSCK